MLIFCKGEITAVAVMKGEKHVVCSFKDKSLRIYSMAELIKASSFGGDIEPRFEVLKDKAHTSRTFL